jgi:serine/threonine protein kinase
MGFAIACPSEGDLSEFLLGRSSETDAANIEAHLAACAACRERLSSIQVEDNLLRDLRGQADRPWLPDTTVEGLVRDLRQRRLENREESASLIDTKDGMPSTAAGPDDPAAERGSVNWQAAGQRAFRPLNFHRRGGLGEVYLAEDSELGRKVALKRIRKRFEGDAGARQDFLREAEITGLLEHPGVVPVHGLVHDADGHPCYVMRFIQGESLKDALEHFHAAAAGQGLPDYTSLEFRRLLSRFIAVCNTIAYAHSRGIIHRDLKPANIMLGKYGETLVVDWGLARTIERDDAARASGEETARPTVAGDSTKTRQGDVKGTVAYMSPEQASGFWDAVGPAADIFSLGATLYQLLVGRPPYVGDDALARARRGEFAPPRQVQRRVPATLEAVCRKAMAAKPEERYRSPSELADDLERWLADESLAAFREPLSARTRRWARKHPRTVAGLAAAVLVAVAGLSIGLFVVNAERKRTELARQGEETQRIEAERQTELARKNEDLAHRNEQAARGVLTFLEDQIFAAARPTRLGRNVTLRQAVDAAVPYVEKAFANQPLIEAKLRMTLAISFRDLGDVRAALEQDEAARALLTKYLGPDHPDTLISMNNLAICYSDLGRRADAVKLHEEILKLRKAKLGADHPHTLASMNNLAVCYRDLGRHVDAVNLHEEILKLRKVKLGADHPDTLTSMNNLAICYSDLGRHAEAIRLDEEILKLRKTKLGADHPDTLASMNNLAVCFRDLGRHTDAIRLHEETLKLRKVKLGADHPDTLTSMNNLAVCYRDVRRHADAVRLREETLKLRKAKLGADHPATLASMDNLAISYFDLGRYTEALSLHEQTLRLQKAKIGPDHPDTLATMNNLTLSLTRLGRHADALKFYEETLALKKTKLGPNHPSTWTSMNNVAVGYALLGRHAEALKLHEETLALRKASLGPDHPDTLSSMLAVAAILVVLDRGMEAISIIDDCLQRAAHKKADPRLISSPLEVSIRRFQKAKDIAGCQAVANCWEKLKRSDADSLYNAACYRAVTAAVIRTANKSANGAQQADAEADRAMAWLHKAVAAGYKNVAHLKKTPDLDALRQRPDFQKLLADLETKTKP